MTHSCRVCRAAISGLVCILALFVLAACSDDDDSSEAAPEPTDETTTSTTDGTTSTTQASTTSTTEMVTTTTLPPRMTRSLEVTEESPGIEPGFTVHRPADLQAGAPAPIIVWANGGCVRFDQPWKTLFERWAQAGFFVVSLAERPQAGDSDEEITQEEALADPTTVADHAALIDWAFAQNEAEDGPYGGLLDTSRVVAAGNSCGGITALGLAAQDPRVSSVFVLSGSSTAPGLPVEDAAAVMDRVSVPVGFVVGGASEDIAYPQAMQDFELLAEGIPAMVTNRSSADHQTVSTDETMLADVAEIGLAWMDLSLYGTEAAAEALASDRVCPECEPGLWTVTAKNF